jgi:hypothetical protein
MGAFVDWVRYPFSNLSNEPQTIIVADTHVLEVTSIKVTNLGTQPIRINLKQITTQASPVEVFLLKNSELGPYESKNLIDIIGNEDSITLEYSSSPSVSDSLVCYSNGYSQQFDCVVKAFVLKELPWNS